jgi:hypothetical protein
MTAEKPQQIWLDTAPLLGFAGREKSADLLLRSLGTSEWMANELREAPARLGDFAGEISFYGLLDSRFSSAYKQLDASVRPEFHAVIPNVRSLIREATEYGMIGAGIRKGLRVGVGQMVLLGLTKLGEGPAVLQRKFPAMFRILVGLELAEARRAGASTILLQQQMTDLALAMDNVALLSDFLNAVHKKGCRAGFTTANPAFLHRALQRLKISEPITVALIQGERPGSKLEWPENVSLVVPESDDISGTQTAAIIKPWPVEWEPLSVFQSGPNMAWAESVDDTTT